MRRATSPALGPHRTIGQANRDATVSASAAEPGGHQYAAIGQQKPRTFGRGSVAAAHATLRRADQPSTRNLPRRSVGKSDSPAGPVNSVHDGWSGWPTHHHDHRGNLVLTVPQSRVLTIGPVLSPGDAPPAAGRRSRGISCAQTGLAGKPWTGYGDSQAPLQPTSAPPREGGGYPASRLSRLRR